VFPACVDNAGIEDGDSVTTLGIFQTGILNSYPSAVVIVATGFELEYNERAAILDNLTGATTHAVVTGARVTLVGVPGATAFNGELRALATAYGAAYADGLDIVRCAP
jgi:hypothetical protein